MSRAQLTSTVEQNTGGAVAPFLAGKNFLANGSMEIWQRGTSFSSTNTSIYTADRWNNRTYTSGASLLVTQDTGTGNFKYSVRLRRSTSNTDTSNLQLFQNLETVNSLFLAGQTITFSFYAKAGANYSPTGSALVSDIITGTTTDQPFYNISGGSEYIQTNTLTTSWKKFSHTITVGSSMTQVAAGFVMQPTGTAGADDSFYITGVQLEIGSVPTPFSRAGGTLQGELALCERFYETGQSLGIVQPTSDGGGNYRSYTLLKFAVTKRSAPAIVITSYIAGTLNKVTSNMAAGVYGGSTADSTGTAAASQITTESFVLGGVNSSNKYFDGAYWTASAEL